MSGSRFDAAMQNIGISESEKRKAERVKAFPRELFLCCLFSACL